MTRKDYELIASRIRQTLDGVGGDMPKNHGESVLEDLALALSEDFKRDNPNFQPERFLTACGMTL